MLQVICHLSRILLLYLLNPSIHFTVALPVSWPSSAVVFWSSSPEWQSSQTNRVSLSPCLGESQALNRTYCRWLILFTCGATCDISTWYMYLLMYIQNLILYGVSRNMGVSMVMGVPLKIDGLCQGNSQSTPWMIGRYPLLRHNRRSQGDPGCGWCCSLGDGETAEGKGPTHNSHYIYIYCYCMVL